MVNKEVNLVGFRFLQHQSLKCSSPDDDRLAKRGEMLMILTVKVS